MPQLLVGPSWKLIRLIQVTRAQHQATSFENPRDILVWWQILNSRCAFEFFESGTQVSVPDSLRISLINNLTRRDIRDSRPDSTISLKLTNENRSICSLRNDHGDSSVIYRPSLLDLYFLSLTISNRTKVDADKKSTTSLSTNLQKPTKIVDHFLSIISSRVGGMRVPARSNILQMGRQSGKNLTHCSW